VGAGAAAGSGTGFGFESIHLRPGPPATAHPPTLMLQLIPHCSCHPFSLPSPLCRTLGSGAGCQGTPPTPPSPAPGTEPPWQPSAPPSCCWWGEQTR
jgi:hypothetical protein